MAAETTFQEPLLQFIWEIAAQESVNVPGDIAGLLAAVPELNSQWLEGESPPRVFVSGWGETSGVLIYREAHGPDNWQAIVAASNERALRDLLHGFPGRGSGTLFLCGRWLLPAVRDVFMEEKMLPERVGYYATPDTFIRSGAARAHRPRQMPYARSLGGGLLELEMPRDSEADADALEMATADVLADDNVVIVMSPSANRPGVADVLEVIGYRLLYRLTVFRGTRRGAPGGLGHHADRADGDGVPVNPLLASKDTPVVQRLRSLREPMVRRAEASFVAEGPTLVQRAVRDGLPVESVLCLNAFAATSAGREVIDACARAGIGCYRCSDGLMGTITSTRPLPAVMAAVHLTLHSVAALQPIRASILLVAEDLQNPDNLGMVLRTADGAGADAVVVTETGVDPLHKNCVRAARGAVGRIPLYTCADLPGWLGDLSRRGFTVLGATAHGDADLYAQAMRPPLAFVIGNEETGLRPETLAASTSRIRIPMAQGQSSLNVGVAAGVLLYEFVRRSERR